MKSLITFSLILFLSLQGFSGQILTRIDSLMQLYYEHNNFSGTVLVAQHGEVLFSGGYGYADIGHRIVNDRHMKYRIASNSKQFTAMLILQKVADGRMDLDASIRTYIPDYPQPQGGIITIHHLLSHTSGMPHYAGIPDFFLLYGRQSFEHRAFVELFWDLELLSEPGEKYSYSSFGYYLLGYILEEVSGKRFPEILETRILAPLGMEDTGVEDHRRILTNRAYGYNLVLDGFERAPFRDLSTALATGDMYSSPMDMVKWDRALHEHALLDKEWQDLMFRPNLDGYGYGWRMGYVAFNENDSVRYQQHTGGTNGFTTLGTRLPDDGYYILVFCNTRPGEIRAVENNIIRILYDQEVSFRPSIPVSASRILREEGLQPALEFLTGQMSGEENNNGLRIQDIAGIGADLLSLHRHSEAIAFFELGTKLFPETASAAMMLGDAYRAAGQYNMAIQSYARALLIDPEHQATIQRLKHIW